MESVKKKMDTMLLLMAMANARMGYRKDHGVDVKRLRRGERKWREMNDGGEDGAQGARGASHNHKRLGATAIQ